MNVLGIMNGTSVDAVDYVWIRIQKNKMTFIEHIQKKFQPSLQKKLVLAGLNQQTSHEVGELHYQLGREYLRHLKMIFAKKRYKTQLIGLHGQTIYHRGRSASLQIGEPSFIAQLTNAPVIHSFRNADISNKGEGAPLAPLFHQALAQSTNMKNVAFHNLGGISNLTRISTQQKIAFDTGPANGLMDLWLQHKGLGAFDKNGRLAAKGLPNVDVIRKMLSHPFLKKKPVKSCGREEFNLDFIKKYGGARFTKLSLEDQISTLCEFSVITIVNAYRTHLKSLPPIIYFYGGGTKNAHLMKRLRIHFTSTKCVTTDDIGWPVESVEAATFAYLAYQRQEKKKLPLRPYTGGSSSLLGSVCEL